MVWRYVQVVLLLCLCLPAAASAFPNRGAAEDQGILAVVERISDEWIVLHLEPHETECVLNVAAVRTVPEDVPLRAGAWGLLKGSGITECNEAARNLGWTFEYDAELTQRRAEQISAKVAALRSHDRPIDAGGRADATGPASPQFAAARHPFARWRLLHAPDDRLHM